MNSYSIPTILQDVFRRIVGDILMQEDKEQAQESAVLKKQKSELENKLKKCKVKFGTGDIDEEIYAITVEDLQQKLEKVEVEIAKVKRNLSNLYSRIDDIVTTCCKLGGLWHNSELELKERIQNLLFPNGILWDKEIDNYRTIDENSALFLLNRLSMDYKNKKEENSLEDSSLVNLCG